MITNNIINQEEPLCYQCQWDEEINICSCQDCYDHKAGSCLMPEAYKRGNSDMASLILNRIKSRKEYLEEYYPNDVIAIAEANVYLEIINQLLQEIK